MTRRDFINVFRDAPWINRERITLWATCFGVAWVLFLCWDAFVHSTHGITDAKGEHIGRDFINWWSGALLAAEGKAAVAYNAKEYLAFQKSFAGELSEFKIYSYPPVAMLLTLPLALCSFMIGYLLWTLTAFALGAKLLAKHLPWRMALVCAIAAPACFVNIQSGQNGVFTAVLLGCGLTLLDRRPVVAGLLLGALCYKPQLGVLLPLALAAGGYWRSFFAAAATVVLLVAGSELALNPDAAAVLRGDYDASLWYLFAQHMKKQTFIMEQGMPIWQRMPTAFAGVRMSGGPLLLAYAAQTISAIAAVFAVAKTWRGTAPLSLKSAVLVLAVFLASPYAWDYDMVVVVLAALWVADDAKATGWLPWEKFAWFMLLMMPMHLPFSKVTHVQFGVLFVWAALWLLLARLKLPRVSVSSPA